MVREQDLDGVFGVFQGQNGYACVNSALALAGVNLPDLPRNFLPVAEGESGRGKLCIADRNSDLIKHCFDFELQGERFVLNFYKVRVSVDNILAYSEKVVLLADEGFILERLKNFRPIGK